MPNFVTRQDDVRAERNESEFPTHIPTAHGDDIAYQGDWIVTRPDGSRYVVKATEFGDGYDPDSGNADEATRARVHRTDTGARVLRDETRYPYHSTEPVAGFVEPEEPYNPPTDPRGEEWIAHNPAAAESAAWQDIPGEVYAGESPPNDVEQGAEAKRQLEEQDPESARELPEPETNDVGQSAEAVRQASVLGQGATVEDNSPAPGVEPVVGDAVTTPEDDHEVVVEGEDDEPVVVDEPEDPTVDAEEPVAEDGFDSTNTVGADFNDAAEDVPADEPAE